MASEDGSSNLLNHPPKESTVESNRGFAAIGLHMPKTYANVGSVLRAAACYKVAMVAKTGERYRPAATDTAHAYRHLPFIQTDDLFKIIPFDCVPVAIELLPDARSLVDYVHPERAFYIFRNIT